jgi:hypothetical protein
MPVFARFRPRVDEASTEERVWVLHQKPKSDCARFVFELKLRVQLDRPSSDRISLCAKPWWRRRCVGCAAATTLTGDSRSFLLLRLRAA